MESQTSFKCTYCNKSFQRERTLQVHMCEPKRRHLQKGEKWVQNGFMVFCRFYEIHQKNTKPKTYDQFCDSSYYNAFVKFGRYMMHTAPLYPEKYIDYVILSKVKLDHWSRSPIELDLAPKNAITDAHIFKSKKSILSFKGKESGNSKLTGTDTKDSGAISLISWYKELSALGKKSNTYLITSSKNGKLLHLSLSVDKIFKNIEKKLVDNKN